MPEEFDIWDLNNQTIREVYEKNNYECIDTGKVSKWCYIFFSSNGLYYPDTKENFDEQIVRNNRYEWKWVVKNSKIPQNAGRIIYVRDIYKRWYSYGINATANSIDKTIELLKRLTEGFQVVTIGSSAGGYMATLAAVKLQAAYCINFSGQYKIAEDLGNPYYNLVSLLENYQGKIFYFVPALCPDDVEQYQLIDGEKCVKCFYFDDNKHASTMLTGNMPYIVESMEARLEQLYDKYCGKRIHKIEFLLHTVPVLYWGKIFYREIKGYIIRRSGRHWNGV